MGYLTEKEYIIIIMETDMKVILKMIKEKGMELYIILMKIERWVIIQMTKKWENM